ncbi:MAG: dephospho-CoA kinase [Gemmatimonadaceae bacterium]
MMVVGLTGNIASGKSSVARLLVERGARLIDADVLARRAVEPGTPGLQAITKRWGSGVLMPDGALDRAALRRVVFANRAELEALNAIVHPEVERLRQSDLVAAREQGDPAGIVICDIPLLFEAGLEKSFDRIVLVDAPAAVRLARLMEHRQISRDEAEAMMASQLPAESKRARAHYVVENDGTLELLQQRVATLWHALTSESAASRR